MKNIISSQILPESIKTKLLNEGFCCVDGGKSENIHNETRYHPDILYHKLSDGTVLTSGDVKLVHNLDTFCELKISKSLHGNEYPKDCIFNCFSTSKHLVCGSSVAQEIVEDSRNNGKSVLYVRQGYAACSTIKLAEDAFITADRSISKKLTEHRYSVLLTTNYGIKLSGYSNGFIGGCALVFENRIYFTGNIKKHIDYEKIKSFCFAHKKDIVSLSNDDLYDYGGFIVL